jgi:DNA invertase Pin-like site-specific DNA recombinase
MYGNPFRFTSKGRLPCKIIAMAAEIERDLISSRTTEALRYRKEQGMKLGSPVGSGKSKLDQFTSGNRSTVSKR